MHWYVNYPESEMLLIPMYNVDFSYPAHLHGCFEITFCIKGMVEVTVDGTPFPVEAAHGILIPPNTVHTYRTPHTSEFYTILYSRSVMPDFSALFVHKRPHRCLFPMDEGLTRQLSPTAPCLGENPCSTGPLRSFSVITVLLKRKAAIPI